VCNSVATSPRMVIAAQCPAKGGQQPAIFCRVSRCRGARQGFLRPWKEQKGKNGRDETSRPEMTQDWAKRLMRQGVWGFSSACSLSHRESWLVPCSRAYMSASAAVACSLQVSRYAPHWGQPQSVALATVSQAVAWKLARSALPMPQPQQNKNYPAALFEPGRFCSAPAQTGGLAKVAQDRAQPHFPTGNREAPDYPGRSRSRSCTRERPWAGANRNRGC
jgi:hypothetical protein